jgi:hypothetical protein
VDLSPSDHVVELNVVARADSERFGPLEGRWEGLLPVVPGASFAVIEGTQLVVSSPVARDVAYVDLVRAGQVVHSLDLPLQVSDQSQGISRARWPLGTLGSHELFAVVSSEPDFRSMALVGWPLSNDGEVNATWDLRSRLVFDGVAQNRASSTRRSRNSALFGFGCVAVGALVEAGLFWMLWRKVTAEMRAIDALPYQMQRLWVWGLVTCLIVALLGLGLLQF